MSYKYHGWVFGMHVAIDYRTYSNYGYVELRIPSFCYFISDYEMYVGIAQTVV